MAPVTRWNGTDRDLSRLQDAVNHNCMCKDDKPTCPAHSMLLDQKVLDHLVFVRKARRRYQRHEFDPLAEWGW